MEHIKKLARLVADTGIKYAFGVPGSGPSLTLIDEMAKAGIQFIRVYHEQTAAVMAGTLGRITGLPHPAIAIKGPGLANMVPGMAFCNMENFPTLAISEAYAPSAPIQKAHKRLAHEDLVKAVVNYSVYWDGKESTFQNGILQAKGPVSGVFHLNISGVPINNEASASAVLSSSSSVRAREDDNFLDGYGAFSKKAVIVGSCIAHTKWKHLIQDLDCPVFTTAAAKGLFDETKKNSAGVYTGAGGELSPEKSILSQADVIVCFGLRHPEVLNSENFECPSINIDPAGFRQDLHKGFIFDKVVAGSDRLYQDLQTWFLNSSWPDNAVETSILMLREYFLKNSHFLVAHAFEEICSFFNGDARIIMDTGLFCTVGEHMIRSKRLDLTMLAGQSRYMGSGLPMALAASIFDPSIPTIAVLGDGSIGMGVGEMKLAVQLKLPLIFILMSDGNLGTIRTRAVKENIGIEAVRIAMPSWEEIAKGFGMSAYLVDDVYALKKFLKSWSPSSGPGFCQLRFDPDCYLRMCDLIR